MDDLISIVVPVYNVEKYIEKCIDSILLQTYSNIEILLIDDGSLDSSGKICDKYERLDKRIRVFHKLNGGLSEARNFGIEHAKGQFIGFVDSDDYIDADMYEILYNLMIENNADMVMCGLYDLFDGKPRYVNTEKKVLSVEPEEAIKIVLEAKITSVTAVNKLYRKELFDNIRYPVGKTAEDAFVIVDLLDKCKTIVVTSDQKYYYVHRNDSITTQAFSRKNLDAIEAYEKNYELISDKYPALIDTAKMRLCWAHFYVLDRLVFDHNLENKPIKKKVTRYLRRNCFFILKDNRFLFTRKISEVLLLFSTFLYKICVIIQRKRFKIT